MTKNQSLVFRCLLFLFGAGIIILAFFLNKGDRELNRTDAFVWSSIGVMYLVFFVPFFFSSINIANFSGKIPNLPLVWIGIILYSAASILIIVLVSFFNVISFNMAIVIQTVLLFLFFIDVFFAFFASSYAGNNAAGEAVIKQNLSAIKPKAQILSLSADGLPHEYEKAQKTMKQALDDIKYIFPVNNGAGNDLESRILQSMDNLTQLLGSISTGAAVTTLESEAANLQMLVKERKLLRN